MKKILLILSLFIGLFSFSQVVKTTPGHAKKLVFHGNSLFHLSQGNVYYGFGISNYVRTNMSPRPPVEDYSYQGKTTQQLTAEFPTVVAPYVHPGDVLVFWEGTNGIAASIGNQTPAQELVNIKAYITQAESYGLTVISLTCIPRNSTYVVDADRLSLNALILADNSINYKFIDICTETIFDAQADCTNTTYYETDQTHLKTVAQAVVGARIKTVAQTYFP